MEIKADKIHKAYGTITVLDDISFSLERGQKAGLIGYNGTGKTTLLKILAGLVEPDSGEITTKKGAVIGSAGHEPCFRRDHSRLRAPDFWHGRSGKADGEVGRGDG